MRDRILIVDDSGTARMFVRRCLEITRLFTDPEFVEAANGQEALACLKEQPCSFVFTDLTMPEMDGEALLARIKGSPRFCDIPVVVVSSAGNPARDQRLQEMGAVGVLKKPLAPQALMLLLREMLANREG